MNKINYLEIEVGAGREMAKRQTPVGLYRWRKCLSHIQKALQLDIQKSKIE
jgi:hypothetical protein